MTRRRSLLITVCSGLLLLATATAVPFVSSLNPSERARAIRDASPQTAIVELQPGEVRTVQLTISSVRGLRNGGWSPNYGERALFIRDYEGTYYSYLLPTWTGQVVMPYRKWGQWEGDCRDFGPVTKGGYLQRDATIKCKDPELAGRAEEGEWAISGEGLTDYSPDLIIFRCLAKYAQAFQCH